MAKKAARNATKKAPRTAGRKKAAAKAAPRPTRITAASKARTKGEVYNVISEQVGISRKEVAAVFDTIGAIAKADLSKGGPGVINLGGLMKVTVQRKPATKARKGINPFTKEEVMFKAKPARNVVKIRPMKAMKDLV
ncbi:MAG TPA: HU family DNA-binding protein [Phycisphaerales bacterium]|nr:HU family DNA-binding protein [Phycisphaerales bacterium]